MSTRGRVTRHASWLELFYDLLFVALFSLLAHGLVADPGVGTTLRVLGLFAPAWWVWVSYTVSSNLYGEWGREHRLGTLGTMACLLPMTAGVAAALDGSPALYAGGFAASRLVLLGLVVVWQLRRPGEPPPRSSYVCYSVSAALWLASIPVGPPLGYGLWAVSLAVELAVRLREQVVAQRRHVAIPFDVELLAERFGLLVIVGLGEGVVQIAGALSHRHVSAGPVTAGIAGFVILATLWWGYFAFADGPGVGGYERGLVDHAVYARRLPVRPLLRGGRGARHLGGDRHGGRRRRGPRVHRRRTPPAVRRARPVRGHGRRPRRPAGRGRAAPGGGGRRRRRRPRRHRGPG